MDPAPLPDPPAFNMIAGALQLAAVLLYTGAETPYNPVTACPRPATDAR